MTLMLNDGEGDVRTATHPLKEANVWKAAYPFKKPDGECIEDKYSMSKYRNQIIQN